ncbi:hypothetical protein A3C21_00600 [Candidatus Kaiserbacteria bacterium RIFCSPHIGHO2_02_FULL_59_21]|uniref:Pyrroloquinoline quinone-dependent pyranose dehydrogenase beta-propeller domain-containing protein n=1 Tax=Candidatus Kaiserbacteria bacterium RIFCSPHIGHO2_02_FULL_59_21 TaxID=1798500 RepID=A0A1F6E019_9BACT|nr:MAG: hypothetical protein A2766_01810 [Candidatus Kaiserbacteria bacterium RIFCSPHIGHO2_01_FULL_58_22]OGG66900.1 MAG: hypothetical protein A3C21_00600 [Candidatus Kaiserbacteria bacterium RIFCSPHIGHO2_02_FULL_59_21]OGG80579.1 MAG: hypothetical protein A2952_00105 [Candidatus Kaiserbacteria bacterium RIFCSPLOWO2_01_FULL_59_34]OGG85476.1 MAG: hypothetical protein A3I47_00825 [Candidatus Kaiserbacteria bacterium RIFCSPLOWO2_02_FULL_59_19]
MGNTRMNKAGTLLVIVILALAGLLLAAPVRDFVSGILPIARPAPPLPPAGEPLPFSLPEGFTAYLLADNVPGARVMARDPGGALLVSLMNSGKVVALLPRADGSSERIVLLEGLQKPHGLAVRCTERCELYVAEEDGVSVYQYAFDEATKTHRPVNGKKILDLPDGGHSTRSLLFMPDPNDHKLLVSVGSSCNVCIEADERRAKLLIANADGSDLKEYATGLRNTVFMAIHYVTGDIWGAEMGRDHLGDDLPPDEVNIIREGGWYGWPWFYGKNVEDPALRSKRNWDGSLTGIDPLFAQEAVPSHIDIPAHSALLGLAFIPEEGWPEEWWYDLLVAYHGSWNRSVPTGYKIVRFPLDAEGNPEGPPVDFMTGFMTESGEARGRPVDILIEPGGVIYVSDDRAGAIYRIVRTTED